MKRFVFAIVIITVIGLLSVSIMAFRASRKHRMYWYSFIEACKRDRDKASRMLEADPNLISARGLWGETALHFLVVENQISAVDYLFSKGASPNVGNKYGDMPLIDAATLSRLEDAAGLAYFEMVKLLVAHGADVNVRNRDGETALYKAAEKGHLEIFESLLESGADHRIRTSEVITVESAVRGANISDDKKRQMLEILNRHHAKM